MFLSILRISASNVLKMVLNIVASIAFTVVIFHSIKPTGSTNTLYCIELAALSWPRQQARKKYFTYNNNDKKNQFKTNLYMHNTLGDVALANWPRNKLFP